MSRTRVLGIELVQRAESLRISQRSRQQMEGIATLKDDRTVDFSVFIRIDIGLKGKLNSICYHGNRGFSQIEEFTAC